MAVVPIYVHFTPTLVSKTGCTSGIWIYYFQKPREHLMPGSGPFVFTAICPKCKDLRSQLAGNYRLLIQLLESKLPIEAHCKICGGSWTLSKPERARLETDLTTLRFF
jgi:hypothetical protein